MSEIDEETLGRYFEEINKLLRVIIDCLEDIKKALERR